MPNTQNEIRRPLKVVVHSAENFQTPIVKGGSSKIFDIGDFSEHRSFLLNSVDRVSEDVANKIPRGSASRSVAKVILRKDAWAKSHRPTAVFNADTCPIIGYDEFGTLLIGASESGVSKLKERINRESKRVKAALSTIEKIAPYSVSICDEDLSSLVGKTIKIRLFRHDGDCVDKAIETDFFSLTHELGLACPVRVGYVNDLRTYKVKVETESQAVAIKDFYGTQSLSRLSQFEAIPIGSSEVLAESIIMPPVDENAPVIGLLDTGVSDDVPGLSDWIVGRDAEDVPEIDRDYSHGTFIAGLLVAAYDLNNNHAGFPKQRCRIFDAIVMPKGGADEVTLLDSIKRVVAAHPEIRVWNLSANLKDGMCKLESFSTFAIELDALQEQHNCIIVCSAGNYDKQPRALTDWKKILFGDDIVSPPAENLLGITVGSVAHLDSNSSYVGKGFPSPFSRRGPSSGYVQKPDVCHYGGNYDFSDSCVGLGVKSFISDGSLVYSMGTSFAAPLVAITLAHILSNTSISTNLAKALLVHSAVMSKPRITKNQFLYMGYGVPKSVDKILSCEEWEATLVFETTLLPSARRYDHVDFPLPSSLIKDGLFNGDVTMTLVYNPILDGKAGAEYCRTNVNASIGVRGEPNIDGNIGQERLVHPVPRSMKGIFEKEHIMAGMKWKPLKVFHRRFKDLKIEGDWGVRLEVSYRDELDKAAQDFALVVSISDPSHETQVYEEVVSMLEVSPQWKVRDLAVEVPIVSQLRV